MNKNSLNKKFVLISLALLTATFIVMLIAVQIIAQLFTDDYMRNDVLATHRSLNSEVTDVLNEINFGYTRLVQSDLSGLKTGTSQEKQQAFEVLVQNASLSEHYKNVVLCLDEFFCTNGEMDLPSKSFCKKIAEGSDILYLGEINSRFGYLQLGRKLQSTLYDVNGFIVFYVDVALFNGFCTQTDASEGYTQILTQDY